MKIWLWTLVVASIISTGWTLYQGLQLLRLRKKLVVQQQTYMLRYWPKGFRPDLLIQIFRTAESQSNAWHISDSNPWSPKDWAQCVGAVGDTLRAATRDREYKNPEVLVPDFIDCAAAALNAVMALSEPSGQVANAQKVSLTNDTKCESSLRSDHNPESKYYK
jgi:hypothetical protein